MRSNPVRKVLAVVITMVVAIPLGAVIGTVSLFLDFTDPVASRNLYEWGKLQLDRVYRALAFPARPPEHP